MRMITPVFAACCALAANAWAADEKKKTDGMMKKDGPTMQECKDHMAMAKKDAMKKDDAMMKKDAACADMMKKDDAMTKKDGMKKDDAMMKKEEPMKK